MPISEWWIFSLFPFVCLSFPSCMLLLVSEPNGNCIKLTHPVKIPLLENTTMQIYFFTKPALRAQSGRSAIFTNGKGMGVFLCSHSVIFAKDFATHASLPCCSRKCHVLNNCFQNQWCYKILAKYKGNIFFIPCAMKQQTSAQMETWGLYFIHVASTMSLLYLYMYFFTRQSSKFSFSPDGPLNS